MNEQALAQRILSALPHAYIGEDNDGQVVVYTNYFRVGDSNEFTDEDANLGI
jgi:hypothetical protein